MGPKNEKKDGGKKSRDGMGKKRQGGTSTLITPKPVVKTIDFPILQFPRSVSKSSQSAGIVIKKWCIENRVPVGRSNNAVPVFFLNVGNVVEIRQQNIRVPGDDNRWTEIVYIHNEFSKEKKKWVASTITGWVNELYLDPYYEKYSNDEVKILHPTEDPTDARQYMIWDGDVRYNMCGELCVAHIIKKDIDPKSTLESVLQKWKDSPNKGSFSYTPRTIKFGTNAPHLKDILELYPAYNGLIDGEPILAFRDGLKAGVLSWEGMKDRLNTHYLVALVVIDKTGTLIPRDKDGVQHWVLVEKVTRNGNRVELYNPFPNRLQEYSFNEFASSCRASLSGLWVKRKRPLRSGADGAAQERPFEVTLDVPKPPHYQAQQYIDREGGKKTQLCGEFSVAYVLGKSLDSTSSRWRKNQPELMDMLTILKAYGSLSGDGTQRKPFTIGAVLDCWRETQPQLYKHHVVENRPTGTRELISILRAYGYNNPEDFVGFQAGLMDTATRKVLPSPGRMAKMLKTHYLIAGVGIDGTTGRLKSGRAVRHWVVVERMLPIGRHYQTRHFGGNGGWVELYNPFTNILEEYSYLEFTNSMSESGAWDGLWVKRQIQPLFKPQQALFPTADGRKGRVGNAGKKDAVPKWNEEKLRALIEKKLRNGKAPERVLNELSRAGTGWSMEEIASRIPNIKKPDSAQTDDLEALTEHVCKNLGIDSIPPEVGEWLRTQSGGNLSLAADLASMLRNTGVLSVENKKGRFTETVMPLLQDANPVTDVIGSAFVARAREAIRVIKARLAEEQKKAIEESTKKKSDDEAETVIPKTELQIFRVRKYGDPIMIEQAGADFNTKAVSSNFGVIPLYCPEDETWSAIAKHVKLNRSDVDELHKLQVPDQFTVNQKMNWLIYSGEGTRPMWTGDENVDWKRAKEVRAGAMVYAGQLVAVDGDVEFFTRLRGDDPAKVRVPMKRIVCFRRSDWGKTHATHPYLVVKATAVRGDNIYNDKPRGVIYSPVMFDPRDFPFAGGKRVQAFYIPTAWLEPVDPSEIHIP